jgi:protein O-GlcNAc transferase
MAAAYLQKGLVLQAMEAYDAALAISPALSHVRASLGDLWRLQGESGRGPALACYSEALRRDPACAAAWRGLGDARREAGDCTQAAACYQEAVRLQPRNADALTGLGVALRDLGRREEAEAALRAVVALRPQCALALGNLAGMCYDQVGCVAFEGAWGGAVVVGLGGLKGAWKSLAWKCCLEG